MTVKISDTFYSVPRRAYEGKNTNELLAMRNDILVSKTGTTDLAGANLAILIDLHGKKYALVICGATKETRFSDMAKLIAF